MKYSTTRIKESSLDALKKLKEDSGESTLTKVLEKVIHSYMIARYAHTSEGYLAPGTKVKTTENGKEVELVIEKILPCEGLSGYTVVFHDKSRASNGGGFVWRLRQVACAAELGDTREFINESAE